MGEISDRGAAARWRWRAERARADVFAAFTGHGHVFAGEWCDREESERLSRVAERLGPSPARVIQRWPDRRRLAGILGTAGPAEVRLLILDFPDAGWARVPAGVVTPGFARAVEWMTDGFVVFDPEREALLSVDVEARFVETTVIGDGFGFLRAGPAPLPIVTAQKRTAVAERPV